MGKPSLSLVARIGWLPFIAVLVMPTPVAAQVAPAIHVDQTPTHLVEFAIGPPEQMLSHADGMVAKRSLRRLVSWARLSETTCQGRLDAYLVTGRLGLFTSYQAFIHIVDSVFKHDEAEIPDLKIVVNVVDLMRLQPNEEHLHVRGFKEEDTTTTPFDMVVRNDTDRFRVVIDVIDRRPLLAAIGAYATSNTSAAG